MWDVNALEVLGTTERAATLAARGRRGRASVALRSRWRWRPRTIGVAALGHDSASVEICRPPSGQGISAVFCPVAGWRREQGPGCKRPGQLGPTSPGVRPGPAVRRGVRPPIRYSLEAAGYWVRWVG